VNEHATDHVGWAYVLNRDASNNGHRDQRCSLESTASSAEVRALYASARRLEIPIRWILRVHENGVWQGDYVHSSVFPKCWWLTWCANDLTHGMAE